AGTAKAERRERLARGDLRPDGALVLTDDELAHALTSSSVFSTFLRPSWIPRISPMVSAERRLLSAAIVAMTTLTGLVLPSDFERMSLMPADSTTARTEPPAMTPVPLEAGRSSTLAAPKSAVTGCGMVRSTSGTLMM